MISIKKEFDKNAFYSKQKECLFMLDLVAEKTTIQQQKKQKLNLSIAIDISASMKLPVSGNVAQTFNNGFRNQNPFNQFDNQLPTTTHAPMFPHVNDYVEKNKVSQWRKSRLEQAKIAAITAIDNMKNGDFISVIAFESFVYTIQEAVELTSSNREGIKQKIMQLYVKGSTNLYDGWYQSASEIAKNISEEYINRIIMLTDGETNLGITDPKIITEHVGKAYSTKISTTCFGIGEGFNEDLLQKMAIDGGGNFYYISTDELFDSTFKEEFLGLSNLVASDVSLLVEYKNETTLIEQMNGWEIKEGVYNLPNLIHNKPLKVLFKLGLNLKGSKNKNIEIMSMKLKYKNTQNHIVEEVIEVFNKCITKKEWELLSENKEVKVQETLLTIANNKIKVSQAIDKGDLDLARGILSASSNYLSDTNLNDERLTAQAAMLKSNMESAVSNNTIGLRKDMISESYRSRYNK